MTGIRSALLLLGSEDATALWDAVFEVQRADHTVTSDVARSTAADLPAELARRGHIDIYSSVGGLSRTAPAAWKLMRSRLCFRLVGTGSCHALPLTGPLISCLATDDGERAVRKNRRHE